MVQDERMGVGTLRKKKKRKREERGKKFASLPRESRLHNSRYDSQQVTITQY